MYRLMPSLLLIGTSGGFSGLHSVQEKVEDHITKGGLFSEKL